MLTFGRTVRVEGSLGLRALLLLPAIGRPALTLTRDGVQPTGYGLLPWSAVRGIDLVNLNPGHVGASYVLHLFVPDLRLRLADAHPSIRLLHSMFRGRLFGQIISIRIRHTPAPAGTIEQLCRVLWKAAMERNYIWGAHEQWRYSHYIENRPGATSTPLALSEAWTQLGSVLGVTLLLVTVANLVLRQFTNFVPSEAWLKGSLAAVAGLALVGYALLLRRMKSTSRGHLTAGKMVGAIAAMAASSLLIVPFSWLALQNLVGDIVARTYGVTDEISVMTTPTDRYRRRGCRLRLQGPELGEPVCLSRAAFDRLPMDVRVTLQIRRTALGYHVDSADIVTVARLQ